QVTSELRRGVVTHDQAIRPQRVGRRPQGHQVVLPEAEQAVPSELARHQADGDGPFPRWSAELEIHQPDLPKRAQGPGDHSSPRSFLRTGWSGTLINRSLKASRSSSLNGRDGHSGGGNGALATRMSYAPSDRFAVTRTHRPAATVAASSAEALQGSSL